MNYNSIAHEFTVRFAVKLTFIASACLLLISQPAYADKKVIVVLGDSLVAGYGLAPGEAFPEQLDKLLKTKGHDVDVVNAGVSGDTTADGLARLDWSLGDKTDAVILELGANDALRGISPKVTAENLEKIVAKLRQRNIEILLAGMKAPPNMGNEYVNEFDAIYPNLAKKYDLIFYPFFLQGVVANPQLNQADGMHPTAQGIVKITTGFLSSAIMLIDRLEN
jgi:acyl-CoA thioesterase-1